MRPGHGSAPEHRLYLTDLADTVADVANAVGPLQGIVAHSFGAAAVLLAGARNGLQCPRYVMVAPNVIIDDSVQRFASRVGLDDAERLALEQRISEHTGITLDSLRLDQLIAGRDERLLVIHDRSDREVTLIHGERLAALWPNGRLITTEQLGHRRILRDTVSIAAAVAMLADGVTMPVSDLVREVDRQLDEVR